MSHRAVITFLVGVLATAGCGAAAPNSPTPAPSSPTAAPSSPTLGPAHTTGAPASPTASSSVAVTPAAPADAVSLYGYGPQPGPNVTYQPDVILIGGGPAAIRGVSSDGLTWSMDAHAAGVDQLSPGKIMFASSDAVGRVIRSEAKGDVVDVTIAPVGVGEVISDAHLVFDETVPLESLTLFDIPQIADGYEDQLSDELTATPSPGAGVDSTTIGRPQMGMLAATRSFQEAGGTQLNGGPSDATELSRKVGDWTLSAYRRPGVLGLRAERGIASAGPVAGADLKVALDAHIEVADLRVVADLPVTRGEVGTSHFRVFGIKGLSISVQAGAVNGLSDNRKIRIEVPIQLSQRVIIGGFPATLTQKFKFLVQTAITAKNGNLTASGEWDVDGSIGMDGETVTLPTMTSRGVKLIDSLAGVSVGVNGIVAAISFQFGLLFGLPIAGAGPVAAFITSLGLTNGSSLGIVQCKQVSITSVVTAGVGIQVFDPIKKALKKVLGYEVPDEKNLLTKNILQENWVKPDVVACR